MSGLPTSPRTRKLVIAGVAAAAVLAFMISLAVVLTLRSGLFDGIAGDAEDAFAVAGWHEGACLEDMPKNSTGGTSGGDIRPSKVVDCGSDEAQWIIVEEIKGVQLVNGHALDDQLCREHLQRLAGTYLVADPGGRTGRAYCVISKPLSIGG